MHHTAHLVAFVIALLLMLISLAVNVFPTLRAGSIRSRNAGLIRAAIINGIIIACAVVYIIRYQ